MRTFQVIPLTSDSTTFLRGICEWRQVWVVPSSVIWEQTQHKGKNLWKHGVELTTTFENVTRDRVLWWPSALVAPLLYPRAYMHDWLRKKGKSSSEGGDPVEPGSGLSCCVSQESGFSSREDVFTFNLLHEEIKVTRLGPDFLISSEIQPFSES